jgi:arylsulfatase A-like enzyme
MSSNTAPAAVLAVLATVFVSVAAQSAETKRPNILWISCEDISPHLGCYGDPHAITPTLDKLAADGVRYANAFTVAPVCAPNRSGIITGMYPPSIGAHHMRCKTTLPEHVKCFPAYLRQAGYYCTNNSKTDYNFGWSKGEVWDGCSNKAHWRGRNEGQPFFAVFNLTTTHEGRIRAGDDSYAALTKRLTPR